MPDMGFRGILSPIQVYTLVFIKTQDRALEEIQEHLDNLETEFLKKFLHNLERGGWITYDFDYSGTFSITTSGRNKLDEAFQFLERLKDVANQEPQNG